MSIQMLKLVLSLCLVSSSFALGQDAASVQLSEENNDHKKTLEIGDIPGNAFISRKGNWIVRVFQSSSYALSNELELKSNLLGNLFSQNAQAEYAFLNSGDFRMSAELGLSTGWGTSASGSLDLTASQKLGMGFFNAQLGASASTIRIFFAPVSVGYSLVTSPHTIWDFRIGSDVLLTLNRLYLGYASFMWNHSFGGIFQLGLGAVLFAGAVPAPLRDGLNAGLAASPSSFRVPPYVVLPLPQASLSFKF